jgi:hypothetical protein
MPAPPRRKCEQCGESFQPRNWMRHRKACNRWLREQRARNEAAWRKAQAGKKATS